MTSDWRHILKTDPTPWLLEPDNPSVRYFTLTEILDRPATDAEVQEAKAAIMDSAIVREIFARQHPDGHWEKKEKPFHGKGTANHLLVLAELGIEPHERVKRACESVFQYGQLESGGFSYTGTRSGFLLCGTAYTLRFLVRFGYGEDPRTQKGFRHLAETLKDEDGLRCRSAEGQPCLWAAVKALWAFAEIPKAMRSEHVQEVIERLAEAVLGYDFDFAEREKRWLKFGFPLTYQSDVLDATGALVRLGYGPDPRLRKFIEIVIEQQDEGGRWIKRTGATVIRGGRRGQPSKWVTLRALRILKGVYR
ncbi:MAG: hypothetical protein ACE5NP_07395 [Anaerolineae bacterium]